MEEAFDYCLTEEARTTAGEGYRRAVKTAEAAKQEFISFVHEPVPRSTIPYQLGRFEALSLRRGTGGRFTDGMRRLYYDTVLHTEDVLRLLIKTVGVDRCLFGTECPGVGSSVDPATGRSMDNVKPMIENIEWLSAADRKKIFEDNARAVFKVIVE